MSIPGGTENFYGYHFDLKPPNILVEESGDFAITDFGHATFKQDDGDSKIGGKGGTPAYAPPETENQDSWVNRKYDIWPLGCIFLEILAHVIGGCDGLLALDQLRNTRNRNPKSNIEDDRWFQRKAGIHPPYEVKRQVWNWMRRLQSSKERHEHSQNFLNNMLDLIDKMLCVNVKERWSIEQVRSRFEEILDYYRPNELGSLSGNLRSNEDSWSGNSMKVLEDSSNFVTGSIDRGGQEEFYWLGPRNRLSLVPQYSFSSANSSAGSKGGLIFDFADEDELQTRRLSRITFEKKDDAILMQSIIQHQRIWQTRIVVRGEVERQSQKSKHRIGPRKFSKESLEDILQVQLWAEEPAKIRHARKGTDLPRFVTGDLPYRIVIYCKQSIIIVRLAKNARMEKPASDTSPTRRIMPTNPKQDPTFRVSILKPLNGRISIPLSKTTLDEMEEKGKFECKSLRLDFRNDQDAAKFSEEYLRFKIEWKVLQKKFTKDTRTMGPEQGFAP